MIWGIHTSIQNTLAHHGNIFDKRYAISRFGSGSHLMAIVDANSKGQSINPSQFIIVKNLDGALSTLGKLETDVFYWEKYTTKPYVDNGQLKRVGEYLTPWPCFMIAATDSVLKKYPQKIIDLLGVIHQSCADFMQDYTVISLVSKRYNQQLKDVERWYHSTAWATHGWVSNKMIQGVIYHLKVAEIIDENDIIPELIWKR